MRIQHEKTGFYFLVYGDMDTQVSKLITDLEKYYGKLKKKRQRAVVKTNGQRPCSRKVDLSEQVTLELKPEG